MKSPINLINKRYKSLRKSEKPVARFVQNHTEDVVMLSLQGVAQKCLTSDATVLRFCRSLGFFGFSDFKTALVTELLRQGHKQHLEISPNTNSASKKQILQQNLQEQINSTLINCEYEIVGNIADSISNAGKTLIVGFGGSAGVAHIFSDSLASLGIYSNNLRDPSIIRNLVSVLDENDVLVGISHSGETEDVISSIAFANERGVITIGITNFSPSPLADIAQYSLITSVPDNLLGGYSCQARIAQLSLLEMVLSELSEKLTKLHESNYN